MYKLTKDGFEAQKKMVCIFFLPLDVSLVESCEKFQTYMNDFFVLNTSEDLEFYESIGIKIAPTTRVYKKNELKYSVEGMVSKTI